MPKSSAGSRIQFRGLFLRPDKSSGRFFLLISVLLLAAATPASGQEPSPDILHYRLGIRPDFALKKIALTADITVFDPARKGEFSFRLNDSYQNVSVTTRLSPVAFKREEGWIILKLSRPAERVTLHFELSGSPGRSEAGRDVMTEADLFLLWSDRFYPADFGDWARVTTVVTLPAAFKVIAPGKLVGTQKKADEVEWTFETSAPAVCYSVAADSRWVETTRTSSGLPIKTLLHPQSQKFTEQILTTSAEVLKFFSETYCVYPFDEFGFVTIEGLDARRAFCGFVGYEPGYLEKEITTTGHDAHETSLLWWFYTLRGRGPGSFQWTEGFGDYAEILYGEKYGKPIPAIFQYFRSEYLKTPAEQDVLYSDLRGNTPQKLLHGRYPWLMHVLRYLVGDEAFRKSMKLLFEKYRFKTFTLEEFVATLEEGTGRELQVWREEWLERKGVPEVAWRTDIRKSGDSFSIICEVEQLGALYHLPLEIGIETASGLRVEKVNLEARTATFTFVSAAEPKRIALDPRGWILMKQTPR